MDSNEQVVSKLRGGGNYLSPAIRVSHGNECYGCTDPAAHTPADLGIPEIDYSKAPNQSMVAGIKRYVEQGIMPGHFLTALFSDKLTDTFAHADGTNSLILREWVQWVHGEMPPNLTGSLEIMAEHVNVCYDTQKENRKKG